MPIDKERLKEIFVEQPELLVEAKRFIEHPEVLEGVEDKIGKLAHGGAIGSAHPITMDELTKAERIRRGRQ